MRPKRTTIFGVNSISTCTKSYGHCSDGSGRHGQGKDLGHSHMFLGEDMSMHDTTALHDKEMCTFRSLCIPIRNAKHNVLWTISTCNRQHSELTNVLASKKHGWCHSLYENKLGSVFLSQTIRETHSNKIVLIFVLCFKSIQRTVISHDDIICSTSYSSHIQRSMKIDFTLGHVPYPIATNPVTLSKMLFKHVYTKKTQTLHTINIKGTSKSQSAVNPRAHILYDLSKMPSARCT